MGYVQPVQMNFFLMPKVTIELFTLHLSHRILLIMILITFNLGGCGLC